MDYPSDVMDLDLPFQSISTPEIPNISSEITVDTLVHTPEDSTISGYFNSSEMFNSSPLHQQHPVPDSQDLAPTIVHLDENNVPLVTFKKLPDPPQRSLSAATSPLKTSRSPKRPRPPTPCPQTCESANSFATIYSSTNSKVGPVSHDECSRSLTPTHTKEKSIISSNDYNTALNSLLTSRCNLLLGPVTESVIFYSDSENSDNDDSEDICENSDETCQICYKKPTNTTLDQHRRLGGFAVHHKLSFLVPKRKNCLAILTLARPRPGAILTCKYCNHFAQNLRKCNTISNDTLNHLFTHGSALGENPSAEDALRNQDTKKHFLCMECTMIFPTYLSLMVHCIQAKTHDAKTDIYCTLCEAFYSETTLISHTLRHHSNFKCPQCHLSFQTVLELLMHLLNSRPHQQLCPDVQNMLTDAQLQEISQERKINTMGTITTEALIKDTLRAINLTHLARTMSQPQLLSNFKAENENQHLNLPDIISLVAKHLDRCASLSVSTILRILRYNHRSPLDHPSYQDFQYEVNQINIALFVNHLWKNGISTPTPLDNLLYGADLYTGHHLLGPSVLRHSRTRLSKTDLEPFQAIIIGLELLDKAGTLTSSSIPVLNLSPDIPHQNMWPTHFYNYLSSTTVQGQINLEGKTTHHLPSEENYIEHINHILHITPLHVPIVVEMNLLPFLRCHSPETWVSFLKDNLKSILIGFFSGISRISQAFKAQRGVLPEVVVLGQPPFASDYQLSAQILLQMWDDINLSALLISRYTKTVYLPSTGLVGYSKNFFSNILNKQLPTFCSDHSLSQYSRNQALHLIQLYCSVRKQTLAVMEA